jgi:protein-tyrosine-phosphatase
MTSRANAVDARESRHLDSMGMSSQPPAFRILFVCTGNTCRSPLAVAAMRAELGSDAELVELGSAGTAATAGQPASEGAQRVAAADGLDLAGHRSRALTPAQVRSADLIFVMSSAHRAAVESMGAARSQVHLMSEWPEPGEPGLPVFDPFGASFEAYEECWRRLRRHARRIASPVRQAIRERRLS